jgi:hypothetical protein
MLRDAALWGALVLCAVAMVFGVYMTTKHGRTDCPPSTIALPCKH